MQQQGQAGSPSNPRGMPATDDEIREKYLERAIRELNTFARRLSRMLALPAGTANAGPRLRPSAGRHLHGQVLRSAGRGRGGRGLLRAQRKRADEVAQAPRHRSSGRLRDAVRQVPGSRHRPGRPVVRGPPAGGAGHRRTQAPGRDGPRRARRSSTISRSRWPRSSSLASGRSRPSPRRRRPCTRPTSTSRSMRSEPSVSSGAPFASSASGGLTSRRTDAASSRTALRARRCGDRHSASGKVRP